MTLPSTLTPTLTPALILSLTLEPVSLPRLQVERERRLDPAADADERRGARHLAQLDAGATPNPNPNPNPNPDPDWMQEGD